MDVSGWANYVGEFSDAKLHGFGASFNLVNGEVCIGEYENDLRMKGKLSKLKPGGTRTELKFERIDGKLVGSPLQQQ